eukprot:TRINITY_DN3927_c0_g1_i1.p1 TRINITY_DN3927_c0_g1~~TRINITY_DN3927_c0_g1_i1.p1  ORF type:complete len:1241 (-),score=356.30 TRINITY_DN3927_c0_g1_i1:19-3741(-)
MGDTATVTQQVLEQQWLGGETFVAYITSKDKFDEIDKTASQLFKLAQDQMQALTNGCNISNDLSATIKSLYASRTTATLTDMEFDKMMNLYDKMINIDRKSVSTVSAALDAARDDFDFAVDGLRSKVRARDEKLSECVQLHDQQQKLIKKTAKEGKKQAQPVDTVSAADIQADLDRCVGELRTLSKVVLDGVNDFMASYTDWFDALLSLHLKLKCSLRMVAVEDVGSLLVSDLEEDVAKLSDTISRRVQAARDAESVLLLDQSIPVDRCLSHPLVMAHYRAYMREQLAEESLNFLLRIIDYRSEENADARKAAAPQIFDEYLLPSSPKQVNLAGSIVENISKGIDSGNAELFREAERSVLYTLQTDTWRRFISSPQFQSLQRRTRALQAAAVPRAIRTKPVVAQPEPAAESPSAGTGGVRKLLARTLSSKQVVRQTSQKDIPKRSLSGGNMLSVMSSSALPTGDTSELEIPENIAKQELLLLSDNIRRALNEEASSDVVVLVGADSKEFFAHKLILQARCPLLLRSDSAKTQPDGRVEISLPGATARGFKYFLEYIYTGTLPAVTAAVLQELVSLAGQAHLPHLEELCGILAVARATVTDLASQLNQLFPTAPAPQSDDYPKYEAIISAMAASAHEIFSSAVPKSKEEAHPFYDLYKGHLVKLLERDDLVVDSEIQLFDFVVNWAQRHTKTHTRTQELKPLLDALRFTQMSADDLRLKVEPSLLVNDAVLLEAYRFKSTGVCNSAVRARPRKYRAVKKPTPSVATPSSGSVSSGSAPPSPKPQPKEVKPVAEEPAAPQQTSPDPKSAVAEVPSTPKEVQPAEPTPTSSPATTPSATPVSGTPRDDSESKPAEPAPAPLVRDRSWSMFTKKPEEKKDKEKDKKDKDSDAGKKDKPEKEPKEAKEAKEGKDKQKKGIRQFFKKTSDFLNMKGDGKKDKDKKAAADASKRETLAAVPAKEPKRMSGEFRLTKVDFGADGKEQQLTVSADDDRGTETPSGLTPSSSATSIADHANHSDKDAQHPPTSSASPTPSSGPSLTSDGSIAKADVDLVDAMLNEVKSEMEPAAAPQVGNTTSTEEDEDDFASRQQMIEARRTNRSFTTISKPSSIVAGPRRAKDDTSAPSYSAVDLSAVEKLLNEPLSAPKKSGKATTPEQKDHLQDIESLLEQTAPSKSDADSTGSSGSQKGPTLADIEQLLAETSATTSATEGTDEAATVDTSVVGAAGGTPDMGDLLDLLRQGDGK